MNLWRTMTPSSRTWLAVMPNHYQGKMLLVIVALTLSVCVQPAEPAVEAKGQYTMDQREDCISPGFLDIPRDKVTYVRGKSMSVSATQLTCRLQFAPQTPGDTLTMTLEPQAYVSDCDVSLEMQMMTVKFILGCDNNARDAPEMEAQDGKASIWLVRKSFGDTDYSFQIAVTAVRSEEKSPASGASTADTGMIAGIVGGIIALIIILLIICVCCYRKRRRGTRAGDDSKRDLTKESIPSSISYGNDNHPMKNGHADVYPDSPGSGKRLLGKYDESGKPRSALDRFGPPPSSSQSGQPSTAAKERDTGQRRDEYENRDYSRRRDYENRDMGRQRDYEERDTGRQTATGRQSPPKSPILNELERNPRFRKSFHENEAEVEERACQNLPKSPLLSALHNNAKFRKSFHENEADAEDRFRRLSDRTSLTTSSASDSDGGPLAKPKLPPVPKSPPRSPSPQRRGEKIAGIFRAQSSVSSSDNARFNEEDERTARSRDKNDTRHILKPNRGERRVSERNPRDEQRRHRRDDDDSEEERKRDRDRRDEERQRRRREEEEENRSRKKEEERRERRHREEEEEERQRRKETEGEYEGRFKKSASGRKSKGKGPRMGRSRSTGNALEEMEASYQHSRSKSPSSVRSLNTMDDDETDLDSNYMPFRRAGSKTSLYASRSSLYGRKRKNSMGETISLSSYAHDDVDSRVGDFDRGRMSHREKERMFKSTGDLEMRPASATVVRECATQTGSDKGAYIYGRKTLAKERPGKRYSRGTQTLFGRDRRDSTGSARSGRSTRSNQRMKSRSKSQESLRREKRSRSRDFGEDDSSSERSHHHGRSKSRNRDYSDDDNGSGRHYHSKSRSLNDYDESDAQSSRQKPKPKARPRKSASPASMDNSGSDDDAQSGMTSSVAPSSVYPDNQNAAYGGHFIPPNYPMVYPQPGVAYPQPGVTYVPAAPGGPPMMVPVAPVAQPVMSQKPPIAPKPAPNIAPKPVPPTSKWDQLVNLTDGMKKRRRQMGESVTETVETESVLSSMWSHPVHPQAQVYYAPPSYTTAQRMPDHNATYSSTYANSESNV